LSSSESTNSEKETVIAILNKILEAELAGVVRYTHYSLMVYGFGRISIVKWLRQQANEGLRHAQEAGEMITHLGGHPSLGIGDLLETHKHDIGDIMHEAIAHEGIARDLYEELLGHVAGRSVMLEDYARRLAAEEEHHAGEVDKMLRRPGTLAVFADE
jgi:bacterioferritin